jgi:membrane protein DedA with SNARE-associated domain
MGLLLAAAKKATPGFGAPVALALLLPMEAGIPIPVPADLVMLLIGERAADGAIPVWAAVLALEAIAVVGSVALFLFARGPGHAVVARAGPRVGLTAERLARASAVVERRGSTALAVGRGTPGLRTVTVVAAGGSGVSLRRAVVPMAIGASVFLQLHFVLGYVLGPRARDALDHAKGPALLLLALVVAGAFAYWFVRRRRDRAAAGAAFAEAACPLCIALNWAVERSVAVPHDVHV